MLHSPTPYLNKFFDIAVPYVFPIIGLACILEPYIMTDYAPTLLGGSMLLGGIYSYAEAVRHKTYQELTNIDLANSIMMVIFGIVILFKSEHAIELMGYIWGILGISKGAKLLDQGIYYLIRRQADALKLIWGAVNIGLGLLLVLDPAENFAHHIIILGFELIISSAKSFSLVSDLLKRAEKMITKFLQKMTKKRTYVPNKKH